MNELKQAFVESLEQALPLHVFVQSFKEGMALFFSPFTGFWHAISVAISQRPPRRDDVRQYSGAE
jgi:hypothetical protein